MTSSLPPSEVKDTKHGDICSECFGMGRVIDTEGSIIRAAAKQYDTKTCPRCNGAGVESESEAIAL